MDNVSYETSTDIGVDELSEFYERQHHTTSRDPAKLEQMLAQTFCFVVARQNDEIIGIARGHTDGIRGYLAECKLDPRFQGPACITRTDGRIEHDSGGVAREMALRVVERLKEYGVEKIQVLAYGTEVDFCEELGFKRSSGIVSMQLTVGSAVQSAAESAGG